MVRSYLLTAKQRRAVEEYLEIFPDKMPGTIRGIRHRLVKIDLDQMGYDVALLRSLKGVEVPIGRTKGDGWRDQQVKFVVRHKPVPAVEVES